MSAQMHERLWWICVNGIKAALWRGLKYTCWGFSTDAQLHWVPDIAQAFSTSCGHSSMLTSAFLCVSWARFQGQQVFKYVQNGVLSCHLYYICIFQNALRCDHIYHCSVTFCAKCDLMCEGDQFPHSDFALGCKREPPYWPTESCLIWKWLLGVVLHT